MEAQSVAAPARPKFIQAFRPLWITIILSTVLFCADYHRRNAPLTLISLAVSVDRQEPEDGFTLLVDGIAHDRFRPVSLGTKIIGITTPYTEPIELEHFVWYGLNELGKIELKRARVNGTFDIQPTPTSIELHGPLGNFTITGSTFRNIPAGKYVASCRFADLTENHSIRLTQGLSAPVRFATEMGTLDLTTDPEDASFRVEPVEHGVIRTGKTPCPVLFVPKGEYRLILDRDGLRQERPLSILSNETNHVAVKFGYGRLSASTEPAGATVTLDGTVLGQTPLLLTNVVPGRHRLELRKDGFYSTNSEVQIEVDALVERSLLLVNIRFHEALGAARVALEQGRQRDALNELEAAQAAQADDPTVKALLPATRLAAAQEEAQDHAEHGRFADAVASLDKAEQLEPQNATTTKLLAKVLEQRAQTELQTTKRKGQQAVDDARQALANGNPGRASASLEDAKRLGANPAEIAELENAVTKAKAGGNAEVAARRRELEAAFLQTQEREKDAPSFIVGVWSTTLGFTDVMSATERMAARDSLVKPSDMRWMNDHLVTVKVGGLTPTSGTGTYIRMAVATLETGRTEIRAKVFTYQQGDKGVMPDTNPEHQRAGLEDFRTKLSAAFYGDLKAFIDQ